MLDYVICFHVKICELTMFLKVAYVFILMQIICGCYTCVVGV
jgi:hypothetical protein